MRLFSWNVNGLRAVLRKGVLQDFLRQQNPDILCLQEIKAKPSQIDYDFPGYQVFWHPAHRPGYSGTAILVADHLAASCAQVALTTPLPAGAQGALELPTAQPTQSIELPASLELALSEGRVLVLDCPKFYLVDVYTPNSKPDLSRLTLREQTWDPGFLALLKDLEKTKPVITCGDFNAAHTEIDLARPRTNHKSAGFTDQERQGITNLISAGFLDTFRTLHPDSIRYTWWSHWGKARENNVGWRIDYFFISKILQKSLKAAEIYESSLGSDHCPISISLGV